MTSVCNKMRNSSGLTLVELLVAVAIGLILLGGIYQVFVSSTTAYSRNQNTSRLQENGRFVAQILKDTIAGSGFYGCQDRTGYVTNVANPNDLSVMFGDPVLGLEAVGAAWQRDGGVAVVPGAALPDGLGADSPVPGSDILAVRHMLQGVEIVLTGDMAGGNIPLAAGIQALTDAVAAQTPLLIADCEGSSLFRATAYGGGLLTPQALNRNYFQGAMVYVPQTTTFYIRNNLAGVPSLYRRVSDGAGIEELVEGVEMMQVLYGVDTGPPNQAANAYVAANAVGNWNDVVSVHIGLLLRSPEQLLRGPINLRDFDLDNDGVDDFIAPGNDRFVRTPMNITVGLRNRLR